MLRIDPEIYIFPFYIYKKELSIPGSIMTDEIG